MRTVWIGAISCFRTLEPLCRIHHYSIAFFTSAIILLTLWYASGVARTIVTERDQAVDLSN